MKNTIIDLRAIFANELLMFACKVAPPGKLKDDFQRAAFIIQSRELERMLK